MSETNYNVLFLCTGNSARSIMAEAILNHKGAPKFRAYSAGSHPSGAVRTEALRQIAEAGLPVEGLRSKSWDEFAQPGAPAMQFVFTVCDNAANEVCPFWPGQPMTAHWGVPDPAAVVAEVMNDSSIASSPHPADTRTRPRRFSAGVPQCVCRSPERRISLPLALPLTTLAGISSRSQEELWRIGQQ